MRAVVAALLSIALLSGDESKAIEWGRAHCKLFYDGELHTLWEGFPPEVQAGFGSEAAVRAFHEQVGAQLGRETEIVDETAREVGAYLVYVRTARFEKFSDLIEFTWSFDGEGRVAGFTIKPVAREAESEYLEYRTKTALQLPFEGAWYVFWGGRSLKENYHAAYPDQRFAYDFLIMEDGSSHMGEGERNEDYHCFGEPVKAPGTGRVVATANDVEDNVPGVMNPARALGNHVILDHGNGEYSFLAHFKKGTVRVQPGAEVEAGTLLGLCGNSGNSSEPHVHYHLQDTPVFGKGQGMPPQFLDYVADGEPVERGEPVKAQVIRSGS